MWERLTRWWDGFTEEAIPILWMLLVILWGVYVVSQAVSKYAETHPIQEQQSGEDHQDIEVLP